jgi:two-component system chemotaxis sensor kinase CheA
MSEGMEEIIADFVTEAEESLEKIDPLFVELEAKGQDKDLLNEIFRSMHTIKGAAGFLGFQSIVDVAHKAETIMKKLRDNEIQMSSSLISVILKSVDMLKALIYHIKVNDGQEEDTAPLLKELDDALNKAQPVSSVEAPAEEKQQPTEEKQQPTEEKQQPADVSPAVESAKEVSVASADKPSVSVPGEDKPDKPAVSSVPTGPVQTLRVDINRIDNVMNLTGEIVLVRNRLLNIANYLEEKYSSDEQVTGLQEAVAFLDLVTSDMQLAVMKMRMQPIKKVFSKFPRLVRDLSKSLGKEVELNITGEDTEVDRSVIERIGDPMVHIIRNAIDHGLESVEERKKKGKPPKGRVDITAYQQGNQIIIEVSDDGRGIDIEKVKSKALEKGLITEEEVQRISDEAAANLIFLPGFSTVDKATELSGRGVGMDVVKTNISRLNGYVEIVTNKDVGTTFRISIPLTLAIIHALMVRAGGVQYAIPLGPIEETLKIAQKDIDNITGQKVLAIRGKVYPLSELTDILGYTSVEHSDKRYVLVIAIGDKKFCVAVDELLGQEEVVIKTIEGIDTDSTGILGATITGDGKIVLILDPSSMSRKVTSLAKV